MTNLNHYHRFLKRNGYPIPADPRDVVHTVRAIMRVRLKQQSLPYDDASVDTEIEKLESK